MQVLQKSIEEKTSIDTSDGHFTLEEFLMQ